MNNIVELYQNLMGLLAMRWYLFPLALGYCWLMLELAKPTKFKLPILIYSILLQVIFLVMFILRGMPLMGRSAKDRMPQFDQLYNLVEFSWYFIYIPLALLVITYLITNTKIKNFHLMGKIIIGIFLIALAVILFYVLGAIFILATYGFAP